MAGLFLGGTTATWRTYLRRVNFIRELRHHGSPLCSGHSVGLYGRLWLSWEVRLFVEGIFCQECSHSSRLEPKSGTFKRYRTSQIVPIGRAERKNGSARLFASSWLRTTG